MNVSLGKIKEDYIENYCVIKGYQIKKTSVNNGIKIEISNLAESINATIYDSGSLVIGGKPTYKLKAEFEELKKTIADSPEVLTAVSGQKVKACNVTYKILLGDKRNEIKNALVNFDQTTKTYESPTPSEEYRIKIENISISLSVTQYKNGTLFIQGKEGNLLSSICELIETTAQPTQQEVAARFLSGDEKALEKFSIGLTPKIIETAEASVRQRLGVDCFNFLELHDQKYFIASECLKIIDVILPEYSAVVMPASKAFEGFAKKLLLKIQFYPATHFNTKGAGFTNLNDKNFPARSNLVLKEKYAGSYLDKLSNGLDMSRNFMMHSDNSTVTKVNDHVEASNKLDEISDNTKEIFEYFNKSEFGGIYP
jgi:hypothetical protein